jgi:hypothetical protein
MLFSFGVILLRLRQDRTIAKDWTESGWFIFLGASSGQPNQGK